MDVKIWQENVVIPTYEAGIPDKNPMFFEKRVYQGSSGAVYPNPVIESISDEKTDKQYLGLFLENKYLKIMILPELGGRVQMAYDKIAGRHFIYYNQVIKPALVGLCGPWISGGIEFNWPQHHRPSTFEPVDFLLEEHAGGSKTVWVSEVEKMFHTKGMAGFTIYPDKAYLEIKAKLYNRTSLPQTFLWWANPAVRVNDHYQSVFPPDVNAVFDHGKRDVSTFPVATGVYYKVDYSPGTDISRYRNIPVPTSYMAVNSDYNFVGGYEHDTKAGVLHVADHHVSPGKKQWTWGNGDFGMAWDRNLTDEDGPYIELMTGVYTDNQPDFSWLMPYEEKSFTQYFLPYREVGMVKNASKDVLVGFENEGGNIVVRVFFSSARQGVKITLKHQGNIIFESIEDVSPENVFKVNVRVSAELDERELILVVNTASGGELLRYEHIVKNDAVPRPAQPAPEPAEAKTTEELFLIGQHLEQYRHATYNPLSYYQEALKREPDDFRNNNALGKWYLRRGRFALAEACFRKAIASSTKRNPNPYDSEPYYNLGLSLFYQGNTDEAYNAFFKATWSSAWQDSGYFSVARIDVLRGEYSRALEHIDWSIDRNARNAKAYMVKAYIQRKLCALPDAITTGLHALKRDRFNLGALFELRNAYKESGSLNLADDIYTEIIAVSRRNSHSLIEYAIDFGHIGAYAEAIEVLSLAIENKTTDPLAWYYTGYYLLQSGNTADSLRYFNNAALMDSGYCFPNRLDDILVLKAAAELNPLDARAPYYLGNLWYDKRQYDLAIASWETAVALDESFSIVWRNLAIAAFNKENNHQKALNCFEMAHSMNPADARILMELDQLYKRLNYKPHQRLLLLEEKESIALKRDDLCLEIVALHNFAGRYEHAYKMIMSRKFHPWEGGEGKVSGQYLYSLTELAKNAIRKDNFAAAIEMLELAQVYPVNLGEGKLPGARENDIFYWLGCAYQGLGDLDKAREYWGKATVGLAEPSAAMFYNDQQPDKIFYQGLAWKKLGDTNQAEQIFNKLLAYGTAHINDDVKIDYFAVSLPDLLIFEADLKERNMIHCKYISGLGHLGLQEFKRANSYFAEILNADAMHFGARCHLNLSDTGADASLLS